MNTDIALKMARLVVTARLRDARVPFAALSDGRIAIGDATFPLAWAGEGLPRDIERLRAQHGGTLAGVIVAGRRFTPRAIEALEADSAHWSDEAGRARIVSTDPTVAITIMRPPGASQRASRGFKWSRAALDVGEALLVERRVPPLREIAARTDWSLGRVAQVARAFDAEGFTTRIEHGQRAPRTIDTTVLLDSWARALPWLADREDRFDAHATERDLGRLAERVLDGLDAMGVDFALTGLSGLDQSAPFATVVPTIDLYVRRGTLAAVRDNARALGLTPVDEPATILIREGPGFAIDAAIRPIHWPVIHPARLYADLLALDGRGRDAARHVADEFNLPLPA